jgi:hypothetical protein
LFAKESKPASEDFEFEDNFATSTTSTFAAASNGSEDEEDFFADI